MADIAGPTLPFTLAAGNYIWFESPTLAHSVGRNGSNFEYVQSTDGGQSWGSPTSFTPGEFGGSHRLQAHWCDLETPGYTSQKRIHVLHMGETTDDVRYVYYDITGAAWGGEVEIATGASASNATGSQAVAITRAKNGNLYAMIDIDGGTETYFRRSTDNGATWSSALANLTLGAGDAVKLFPATGTGDDADIWAVLWDESAGQLVLGRWDNSAGTWGTSNIAAVTALAGTNADPYFSGQIRPSDGALLVACCNRRLNAATDIVTAVITSGSITAATNVLTNTSANYAALIIDPTNEDVYVGYQIGTTTPIKYKKSTDDMSTWGSETTYSQGDTGTDAALQSVFGGGLSSSGGRAMWSFVSTTLGGVNAVNYANSIAFNPPATVTLGALLDEVAASINAQQEQRMTVAALLDEVSAILNVEQQDDSISIEVDATLDEVSASLNVEVRQELTIAAALDEVSAILNVVEEAGPSIAPTLDEVAANINLQQEHRLTIASTLEEVAAAFNAVLVPDAVIAATIEEVAAELNAALGDVTPAVTIASTLDEIVAAFAASHEQQLTIAATLDRVLASLAAQQEQRMTVAATLDEVITTINALQRFDLSIGATLDEVAATIMLEQIITAAIALTLERVEASIGAETYNGVTLGVMLDEVAAALSAEVELPAYSLTIATVLEAVAFAFGVEEIELLLAVFGRGVYSPRVLGAGLYAPNLNGRGVYSPQTSGPGIYSPRVEGRGVYEGDQA